MNGVTKPKGYTTSVAKMYEFPMKIQLNPLKTP
jgi:hypothetical protein